MKGTAGLRVTAWIVAIALVAVPVVGVLEGWFAAARWPVRELAVHATFRHVSSAAVQAAVRPALRAGFFAVDLDEVRDAVAALPWVGRVEVSKHWPDALDITITEIRPLAHWGSGAVLDADGRIFKAPGADAMRGLPYFAGPAGRSAEVLAFYRVAAGDFAAHGLAVAGVELSARGSWTLFLADGSRVVVGGDAPARRLARFVAALPVLMRGRDASFVYADLRYSNGFAVSWPTPPAAAPTDSRSTPHAADGRA
jgi:cell division protein FtsQ